MILGRAIGGHIHGHGKQRLRWVNSCIPFLVMPLRKVSTHDRRALSNSHDNTMAIDFLSGFLGGFRRGIWLKELD